MTYPELQRFYDIDPSYKFNGWQDIVEQHQDEPWTKQYIHDDPEPIVQSEPSNLTPFNVELCPSF